jgi:hypothetical protein
MGTGFALLVAVAGVSAYLLVGGRHDRKDAAVLPTRVIGTQAVSIVNTGPAGANPRPETLLASHSDLVFMAAESAVAQWTSDQMAGGTYIFIYLPDGLCLAARASPRVPSLALEQCNLQASQRWLRQLPNVGPDGLDYWQLRNLADGRCLAAGNALGNGESAARAWRSRAASASPWASWPPHTAPPCPPCSAKPGPLWHKSRLGRSVSRSPPGRA